ncbi:MAG: hypothetical protein ACP5G1_00810 [Nanopusillaceae archaeon]
MVKWTISNMVASLSFNIRLPLDKIAESLPFANYNPEQFPGLILPLKDESVKALIFNTGKINISGLRDIKDIEEAIENIRKIFESIGIKLPEKYDIKIQNIVINGKFDYNNIDIVRLSEEIEGASYNPESFPAVIVPYEVEPNYKIKFNIFKNGRFVCSGIKVKSEKTLNEEINKFVEEFQEKVIKKYVK